MNQLYRHLMVAALVGLWTTSAVAEPGKNWSQLTPEQRQLLQKAHEDRWNNMPAEQQERMLKGAERWQKMTPEEREQVRERREKFKDMSPEERAALREKHHERRAAFEKLTPAQQQSIRDCKKRKHAGEDVDCRSLWPAGTAPNKGLPLEQDD